jgi:hypothetical protein
MQSADSFAITKMRVAGCETRGLVGDGRFTTRKQGSPASLANSAARKFCATLSCGGA